MMFTNERVGVKAETELATFINPINVINRQKNGHVLKNQNEWFA